VKNKITHKSHIKLIDSLIPCYVLEDGRRVLSGREMQNVLKMVDEEDKPSPEIEPDSKRNSGTRLNRYLTQKTLEPFIYKDRAVGHFEPITCYDGELKINGYEASILIDLCDAFLEARKTIKLQSRQETIASQCEILVRAFAKVGLIALIDEATGYQYERERNELQKLVDAYVAEELRPWSKTFPDSYYQQIFRLRGWEFTITGIKKRPGVVGTWTTKLIYEQLPPGILEELKNKTPKTDAGNYSARLFQSLNDDIGAPHLKAQLNSVITLMEASDNWEEFMRAFNKVVNRRRGFLQTELPLELKPEDFQDDK
jgi:P63C domain